MNCKEEQKNIKGFIITMMGRLMIALTFFKRGFRDLTASPDFAFASSALVLGSSAALQL